MACHLTAEIPSMTTHDRDEQKLIQAATAGDQAAFRALFEEKRERVYWTAYQVLGDVEEARDVTQRVFVKVWKNLDRYQAGYKFNTWLFRIARNAAIDAYRKRKTRGEQIPLPEEGEASCHPEALRTQATQESSPLLSEVQEIFDRLAKRLTQKQRVAFTLRELQGLSSKEVARIMRTTQSTVRNHVFQARKLLRERLRAEYPEYLPSVKEES